MLSSFFTHECIQFVYLHHFSGSVVLHLCRKEIVMVSREPVANALVCDAQLSAYPSQAHPLQVELDRLSFGLRRVTHRLLVRSEVPLTIFAPHTLRAGAVEACF